jgi:hypothetical protein
MKKLPIEQRIMLEQLTGRHTKMDGTPRVKLRNHEESYRQGFPLKLGKIFHGIFKSRDVVTTSPYLFREVLKQLTGEDPGSSKVRMELAWQKWKKANPNYENIIIQKSNEKA